jgi:hypothetical protein
VPLGQHYTATAWLSPCRAWSAPVRRNRAPATQVHSQQGCRMSCEPRRVAHASMAVGDTAEERVLASRDAVVHVGAEVDEVVGHGRAQAQVADAVVAPGVLPLLVAHTQHLPPQAHVQAVGRCTASRHACLQERLQRWMW